MNIFEEERFHVSLLKDTLQRLNNNNNNKNKLYKGKLS